MSVKNADIFVLITDNIVRKKVDIFLGVFNVTKKRIMGGGTQTGHRFKLDIVVINR